MRRTDPDFFSGRGLPAIVGVVIVFSASCAASRSVVASLTANCREVQVGVAHEMMRDNPGVLLLDVRRDEEFAAALPRLPKAREIPIGDLPRRYRELAAWNKEPILIFSRDGIDAASACEFLARQGFPYVSHVSGGVEAWVRGGFGRPSPDS
jgi:rhodanese-related sulfurtransferase